MDENNKPSLYIERALFVIGKSESGKSTQIRAMFRDWRFGKKGKISKNKNVADYYVLSNERRLHVRLRSPHESWVIDKSTKRGRTESEAEFLTKCETKMRVEIGKARRWNFVCPLWPDEKSPTPNAVDLIRAFICRFQPERVRAVMFFPTDRGKTTLQQQKILELSQALRRLPCTEVIVADARSRRDSGLVYSDFFDFT